ncbi:winged helix-turn-helix transcriptional regulator [Pasteurella bettyae]|uniref:winged helix-turn-helix transcriptional regulator n=1 Tax=Pasteurella bettyae TaxID=752 RepID=UPI00211448C2|nr:winged helix-turn-helix transcriptional regulator [Pasteurella bettyae]
MDQLEQRYQKELRSKVSEHFYNLKKKKSEQVKKLLLLFCDEQYVSKVALADLLGMSVSALGRHISALVDEGVLLPAFPQQATHKDQAYIAKLK